MTERFVCADASEARGESLSATASQVTGWLLIEVEGAWGVDAVHDSELGTHVPRGWKSEMQRRGLRPILIRRPDRVDREPDAPFSMFLVHSRRPDGDAPSRAWHRSVPHLGVVTAVANHLDATADPGDDWEPYRPRLALVCTNGRHDACCATRGRPVVRHLKETPWSEQVWECSHIGGDRFAANMVLLPDGLYFGRCEPDDAERVLARHDDGRLVLDHYRGRSTYRYPEQCAEAAVRQETGIDGVDAVRLVDRAGPWTFRFDIAGDGQPVGSYDVTVERVDIHATEGLTCRGPSEQDHVGYQAVAVEPGPVPSGA